MARAADTMKRLTLELGGNDAGIVLPDVDPKEIAEGLFWGAFINGGQTCAALKRLYVHDDVYDEVCDELVAFARKMKVGKGTNENVVIGPVLSIIRYRRIEDAIDRANDTPNGLGGSVWSRNIQEAKRVADKLECGSVWINKHGMIQPNAPFGGVKKSGLGVEFGEEGLVEYTDIQVVFS